MLEEIIDYVYEFSNEKIKVSKGVVILLTVGAFVVGILTGIAASKVCSSKKVAVKCSGGNDFDADEYVRTLNFDTEE